MPLILRWKGYKFLFYALDVHEPPHIHVRKNKNELKIWLESMEVAKNIGFKDHEINEIYAKVKEEQDNFLKGWHDFFGH